DAFYSGVTSATLTLTNTPLGNNGYLYRARITGSCAGAEVFSNVAILTVQQSPVITTAPSGQTLCEGGTMSLSVTAIGTGLTYEWFQDATSLGAPTSSNTLTINNATSPNAGNYTVVVRGTCDATGVTSAVAAVVINKIPTALASNENICSGSTTSIPISNPNGVLGTTFTWTIQSSSNVSGATAGAGNTIEQTLTTLSVASVGIVTYSIVPEAAGCIGPVYTVTVNVQPVPDVLASSEVICSGTSPDIVITNPNSVPGTTFNWIIINSSNVTGAVNGTGSTINNVLMTTDGITDGEVVYQIIPTVNNCAGTPVTVTVTVKSVPVILNNPNSLSAEICSGETLNFNPMSSISASTFTWESVASAEVTSGVTASGSGNISDSPVNNTNQRGTISYKITPHSDGCAGTPVFYVVSVKPLPSASVGDITICSGENALLVISSNPKNVPGTTFTW